MKRKGDCTRLAAPRSAAQLHLLPNCTLLWDSYTRVALPNCTARTCDHILEASDGDDVTGKRLLDILAVVGMHEHQAADALLLALGGGERGTRRGR